MRKEFLATALTFINCGAVLATPHPALAQEVFGPDTIRTTYAMHDIPDPILIKTNLGMASLLIERICETDGSGRIEISLRGADLDPQKGSLFLETKPIIFDRVQDTQTVQNELKSPEAISKMVLRKDQLFMVYLKEKLVLSPTRIVKAMEVVHYCRPILLVDPPKYERSPNFQEQNLSIHNDLDIPEEQVEEE